MGVYKFDFGVHLWLKKDKIAEMLQNIWVYNFHFPER